MGSLGKLRFHQLYWMPYGESTTGGLGVLRKWQRQLGERTKRHLERTKRLLSFGASRRNKPQTLDLYALGLLSRSVK